MSSANLHDSYFRDWISEAGVLPDYLQHYLPPHIAAEIEPDSAQIIPGSFIDEQLRPQLTDLLCRVNLRDGGETFIYCLIEHKSYPDSWVAFQLLRYMVQIWQNQVKEGLPQLTPIVPMVLYHGAQTWQISTQFAALFGNLGTQIGFVPQFEYGLTDLTQLNDEQIRGKIITRVGLLAMKYSRDPALNHKLTRIVAQLGGLADHKLARKQMLRLLKYVLMLGNDLSQQEVNSAVSVIETNKQEQEAIMSSFAKEFIERGILIGEQRGLQIGEQRGLQIGEQRGLQIGEQRGILSTIARLIERKLGPLQDAERERIAQFSEDQQLSLADALVDGVMNTYADLVDRLNTINTHPAFRTTPT
ncbi:MAG: Rpn family recombination-promoting nuclease/putative transposase [Anaerolineae bacterium]|nr:Rpn family recombination-promoting nuclease/putative transposase [Anaerolineae bacterium]